MANGRERASTKELVYALESGPLQEQLLAMEELAKGGQAAVIALCDVVEHNNDSNAKERAAQTLGKALGNQSNRGQETLGRLERMLANRERKVVESAGKALMHFKKNSRARELLRRAAQDADDSDTKVTLLGAVLTAADGDKSEIPFFTGFLKDDSGMVRLWAAGYLGALGSRGGLDECRMVLSKVPTSDAIRTMQMRAAVAAGRIGDPVLIPQLERVGSSQDYGIAAKAARTAIQEIRLGELKSSPERLDFLRNALKDDDSRKWGISHLMAVGDAGSIGALEWAAENVSESGRHEARRALTVLKGTEKGK